MQSSDMPPLRIPVRRTKLVGVELFLAPIASKLCDNSEEGKKATRLGGNFQAQRRGNAC